MADAPHPDVDLAGHALSALEPEERTLVEAHLAGCPACRRELAELERATALLAAAVPDARPDPALRERTFAAIERIAEADGAGGEATSTPAGAGRGRFARASAAGAPSVAAHAARRRSAWRPRVAFALAAAGVAALVGLAGFELGDRRQPGAVEVDTALLAPGRAATVGTVRVTEVGIGRIVALETRALPELDNTREFYEVWFVGPDDSAERPDRVSAGTFHPDLEGRSEVRLTAAVVPANYPGLSVTREPRDGDPRASGPEVLRARR